MDYVFKAISIAFIVTVFPNYPVVRILETL